MGKYGSELDPAEKLRLELRNLARMESKAEEYDEMPDVPFVVDLPDGQKLLVGELPEGTIIEVAAWRGTQKPDSRTTRLLLGVKKTDTAETDEASTETGVADAGIVVAGAQTPDSPSTAQIPKQMLSRQIMKRKRFAMSKLSKAWLITVGVVVVIALGVLAFNASPLKLVHPNSGANLGFGGANTVLVVAAPASSYSQGATVVASQADGNVVAGRVAALSNNDLLLQTETGYTQVAKSNIIGTVVVIVPFIGQLF
jgi:hypothetical protein